jgi:hypothetical protein
MVLTERKEEKEMTKILFHGSKKVKKDGGYILLSTLFIVIALSLLIGIMFSYARSVSAVQKKKTASFYRELAESNEKIEEEVLSASY